MQKLNFDNTTVIDQAVGFGKTNFSNVPEWRDSTVDLDLTLLNTESISGFTPYEYLLYGLPDSERRNDGRLRDKWLKRYAHCE